MIDIFTGIIEEIGTVLRINRGRASAVLTIKCSEVLKGTKIGDSIAVNGVCLTVVSMSGDSFSADVMHETLDRSGLAGLKSGSRVNLERAMAADGRFGGHIVSGHVDGVGTIISIRKDDNAVWYDISTDAKTMRYIVEKGSITIDGISLTVAKVRNDGFSISAIPHTVSVTTLADRKKNDKVNLETDMIGRYVEHFMKLDGDTSKATSSLGQSVAENNKSASGGASGLTREFLLRNGF